MILHEETVKQLKEMIKYFDYLEKSTIENSRQKKYRQMKLNVIEICELFAVKTD